MSLQMMELSRGWRGWRSVFCWRETTRGVLQMADGVALSFRTICRLHKMGSQRM